MKFIEVSITQGTGLQRYLRLDKPFALDEVLPFVVDPRIGNQFKRKKNNVTLEMVEKQYGEHWVKMYSLRYWLFKNKGTECCVCGIIGNKFYLEKGASSNHDSDRLHFNLYATSPDGSEVLMTKDHILPKSKGGKNTLDNFQTMCTICNSEKADTIQ